MTMQQFYQLNEMEKVCALVQYGRLMAQNTREDTRMFLYRMDSFYVSACYALPNDQLTEISCFLEANQVVAHYRNHLIAINPAEREYDTPEA